VRLFEVVEQDTIALKQKMASLSLCLRQAYCSSARNWNGPIL